MATLRATEPARGPGRPPSDAPQRILEAAFEVLKRDGYAGLTTAKVAAASGQNKALIAYYYGSKQGLVAAVARRVSERITEEVLGDLGEPQTLDELVSALAGGVWSAMDHDEGLQRVYFDLASQSVVDPEVGRIMSEMKESHRAVIRGLLRGLDDGP
ncbi:MAG TPA: TetR/AcrR family transcriptional regulator, partial [Solirubrobacterales bacterium]|nr:TetR/AcrR family transcriptional regulator [Solirubrobacterales bacterium]